MGIKRSSYVTLWNVGMKSRKAKSPKRNLQKIDLVFDLSSMMDKNIDSLAHRISETIVRGYNLERR